MLCTTIYEGWNGVAGFGEVHIICVVAETCPISFDSDG